MRISDWSSDVCSSDLIGVGRRHRADIDDRALALDQQRQQPVRKSDQASDIGVDHLPPLLGISLLRWSRAERQAGIVHQKVNAAKCRGKFSDRSIDGRIVTHVEGAGRSEEHTSELQSLMRISYAVFCLQKKKN